MKIDQPAIAPTFWTADRLCQEYGFSRKSVWVFMKSRGLPHIRIGRLLRFDPAQVKAWAQAQAVVLPAVPETETESAA